LKGSEKIILDAGELEAELERRRAQGMRIVLTNGTFDILHVGHVRALEEARSRGDLLLVALNSDASVRSYKGPGRPFVPLEERAEILAALQSVDLVTVFEEPDAHALIRRVRPDVYAKGRDYDRQTLPEAATAREVGAELAFVGDEKTHAASDLVRRLRGNGEPSGDHG